MKSDNTKYTRIKNIKKISILIVLLIFTFASGAFAQVTGDYRSNGNVTFTSANNWQRYNGSQWVNSATVPPLTSGTTTTLNNYTIVDANINVAGTLVVNTTVNTSNSPTITISGTLNLNNGGLYLSGNVNVLSGATFTNNSQFILNSGNMYISGNYTITSSGASYSYGNTYIQNGGTITNNNAFQSNDYLEINGTLSTNGTNFYNTGTVVVNNGGVLNFNQNGLLGSIPVATWNTGSTLQITGVTYTLPMNLDQAFYNLVWNCPSQAIDFILFNGFNTINGNLSFLNTNNNTLQLFNWGSYTLTVGGNLTVSGNTNVMLGGGGFSNVNLNVNGNYIQSGGILDLGNTNNAMNLKGNFTSSAGKIIRSSGSAKISFCGSTQYFTSSNVNEVSNNVGIEIESGSTLILSNDMKVLASDASNDLNIYGTLDMNNKNLYVNFSTEVFNGGTLKAGSGAMITPDNNTNSFTVDNGGTLYIGSVNGITSSSQQGNIQLKGTRTYNANAKYIYYGSSNQVIGNGLPTTITGNLTVQNTSELDFNTNITVSGTLNMVSGLINMGTNTLILSNSSASSLTYTAGLISGKFQRAIASSATGQYIFPMGPASGVSRVLTFNLTSASSTAGNVIAEYIGLDAGGFSTPLNDNGYTVDSYSKEGYWKLTNSGLTNAVYTLSLEAKNIIGVQNPSKLRIIQRVSSVWGMRGTHSAGTGSITDPTAKRTGYTLYGDYVIAGNSGENPLTGSLPVEMKSFSANVSSNNVVLNWITSSELNNLGFDIERLNSTDNNWEKVTFVKGAGTTSQETKYSYTDSKLQSGKYHYRLKQSDFNGNYKYYDLQNEITVTTPVKFVLEQNYPNPFNPVTKIEFQIPAQLDVNLTVYDMSGRVISVLLNKNLQAGYYKIDFDGSKFSSGTYFYNLKAGDFSAVKKMILVK